MVIVVHITQAIPIVALQLIITFPSLLALGAVLKALPLRVVALDRRAVSRLVAAHLVAQGVVLEVVVALGGENNMYRLVRKNGEIVNLNDEELNLIKKYVLDQTYVDYKIGDYFLYYDKEYGIKESNPDVYILSTIDANEVCLISLIDGNRFNDPIRVNDSSKITIFEFDKITDKQSNKFKIIKKSELVQHLIAYNKDLLTDNK